MAIVPHCKLTEFFVQKQLGESKFLMIMFCFVTAAQRMRTSWVKFSLIHFENGTPDLTHVIIFGHGDLIFVMFFRVRSPRR